MADATLVTDARKVYAALYWDDNGSNDQLGPTTVPSPNPSSWSDYITYIKNGTYIDGMAESAQDSYFDQELPGKHSKNITTFSYLTAKGYAGGFCDSNKTGSSIQASAQSLLDITFSVSEEQDYSLTGTLTEFGNGGTIKARLKPVGGSNIFDVVDSTDSLKKEGTLAPGTYQLYLKANVSTGAYNLQYTNPHASFENIVFTVPEPGTFAMVSLLGIVALKRRRK